jgi:hypothetical protein
MIEEAKDQVMNAVVVDHVDHRAAAADQHDRVEAVGVLLGRAAFTVVFLP